MHGKLQEVDQPGPLELLNQPAFVPFGPKDPACATIKGRKDAAAKAPSFKCHNTIGEVAAPLHDRKASGHGSCINNDAFRVRPGRDNLDQLTM